MSTIAEPYQNHGTWQDRAKNRWNEELDGLAKNIQKVDLTRFREMAEDRVVKAWGRVFEQVERSSKDSP